MPDGLPLRSRYRRPIQIETVRLKLHAAVIQYRSYEVSMTVLGLVQSCTVPDGKQVIQCR